MAQEMVTPLLSEDLATEGLRWSYQQSKPTITSGSVRKNQFERKYMSIMRVKDSKFASCATLLLRIGLGVGFLSAVADRFGLWGSFGQPNVEWGNFSRFLEYTHTLNWYLPAGMIPPMGGIATGAEILFGLLLLVGWHTRGAALLSGLLLMTFGVAMTLALGVKAPLNFAVLTGVGGALLLANCEDFPFSLDELLSRRTAMRSSVANHEAKLTS
jgi:uncharacterized membrane protein YphA (DoxX/SURF4 family)